MTDREIIDWMGKEAEIPPKAVDAMSRGYHTFISCRRCGASIAGATWNYCPYCGQRAKHYTFSGTQGWSHAEAETAWRELRKRWEDEQPG